MSNIKLLRVIASMDPKTGGPPNGINYITPFLNELNIETTILCLDNPEENFIKNSPHKIIALAENKTSWQYNANLYNWLYYHLANFDVVIVHGIWIYHSFAVTKAIKELRKFKPNFKIKHFIYPHGMLDSYFQTEKKRIVKSIRNYFYWHLVESKNINNATGIIYTSKGEMEIASKTFSNYNPKQIFNLGYGVAVPNDVFKQKVDSEYFLFLGRFDHKKGIDTIIHSFNYLLLNDHIKLPKLIIAGPGLNSEYGKYIQKLVNDNDILTNHIELKDMVCCTEKWQLIANAKAMILWSHQENFGISVAESLGMSVPVLLSKQVNIWNEIVLNHAGFADNDTVEKLIETIIKFNKISISEYEIMCLNAKKTHEEFYRPGKYANRLKGIFDTKNES
jgi:glycosyltransferase involved in cell wall biosynthesis